MTFGTAKVILRFKGLLGAFALLYLGQSGIFGIIPLFAKLSHFGLTSDDIGDVISVSSAAQFIVIFFILSPILACSQTSESTPENSDGLLSSGPENSEEQGLLSSSGGGRTEATTEATTRPLLWVARVGGVLMAIFLALFGLSYYLPANVLAPKTTLCVVVSFGGLATVWDPTLRSALSIAASDRGESQGSVLGALAFLQTAMNLASPFVWNGLYSATIYVDPSICFYIGSGLCVVAVLLSFLK